MIHLNGVFEDTQTQCAIADFGSGDIEVAGFTNKKDKLTGVLFKNIPPREIGSVGEKDTTGMNVIDYAPDIIINFPKTESIDIVIEVLQRARANLAEMLAG